MTEKGIPRTVLTRQKNNAKNHRNPPTQHDAIDQPVPKKHERKVRNDVHPIYGNEWYEEIRTVWKYIEEINCE